MEDKIYTLSCISKVWPDNQVLYLVILFFGTGWTVLSLDPTKYT